MKRCLRWLLVVFAAVCLFAVRATAAQPVVSPDRIPGTTKIDAEDLLELVETLPDLKIIDSRLRVDRRQGYIENSISLPDKETNCATLARHLANKHAPVIFYCNGPKCGRSGKAAKKAVACGYKQLYWFRGGFEEWQAKGYPTVKE